VSEEENFQGPIGLRSRIELCSSVGSCESAATFRDPAGQLHLTHAHALRRIHPDAVEETQAFLSSPLRKSLERSGALIATEIVRPRSLDAESRGDLWLQHPKIDPISYPWEWTTSQWQAAAELTLDMASQAIDAGWTLKDATPLNVVFAGPRPVLVDVLSFERRDARSNIWLAYGQFVRTFLLPLIAEKMLRWPLQATLFSRDGYEPSDLYAALTPLQRLKPDLLDVITLATLFKDKGGIQKASSNPAAKDSSAKQRSTDPELATHILHKRIARLGKQIRRSASAGSTSAWSQYTHSASHYSACDSEAKQEFVKSVLGRCLPGRVLDIGANTGVYSRLAAAAGAEVVALDSDYGAVESLWRNALEQQSSITALVANIARPTPAAGWRNREQLSLLDRLEGKFDLVLMLAVIHHLILREQLPLSHIADLCASLTRRWALVEWVPPSDPMYQEWLRGRDKLYGNLSEEDLRRAFEPYFDQVDRLVLGNDRVLLLMERNGDDAMHNSRAKLER
jgi:2-polyprenyl-3-methyl-5-hydroxy-6-metoxy-1,4-benzoquinol methylase